MPGWFSVRLGANSRASATWRRLSPSRQKEILRYFPGLNPPQPVPAMPIEHSRCSQGAGQDLWTSDREAHVCFAAFGVAGDAYNRLAPYKRLNLHNFM
jgi:hypothetical protein